VQLGVVVRDAVLLGSVDEVEEPDAFDGREPCELRPAERVDVAALALRLWPARRLGGQSRFTRYVRAQGPARIDVVATRLGGRLPRSRFPDRDVPRAWTHRECGHSAVSRVDP